MNPFFSFIYKTLHEQGITVQPYALRKPENHRLIHTLKPTGAQTLLECRARGSCDLGPEQIYPHIEKILAQLHQTKLKGYGWPQQKNGKLVGAYKTWREFFKEETPQWLKKVEEADAKLLGEAQAREGLLNTGRFLIKVLRSKLLRYEGGVLVHGDSINPRNILVQQGVVSGVLDWEWSIIGDPAWEFCDPAWESVYAHDRLQPYEEATNALSKQKFDRGGFLRRVHLYRPLWLLWSTSLHSDEPRSLLYALLRDMLQSEIKNAG
jgi:thiamine kinase-like enzyme